MKLLIDIPEHVYEHTKEESEDSRDEGEAMRAIANGSQQESCGDAISRQAVLNGIDTYINKAQSTGTQDALYSFAELVVKELPSVTPQQRTGRWIDIQYFKSDDTYYRPKCPFCNAEPKEYSNYCPDCGAKMEVDNG